ncbi:MAG: hypothetical protein V1892_02460 [bacterium]
MNQQINEPTQNSKNIWLIAVAIIFTALITGSGVYWWQNFLLEEAKNEINKNRQELQQLNQQITDLQTQINQLKLEEVDETSTWQTYRNEDYGFEFRYPKIYKKYEIQQTQELGIYKITQSDGLRINKQSSVEQSYLDHILCLSNNFSQSINVGNTKGMKYYLPYGYTEGDCKNIREEYPNNKPLTFIIVNVNNTSYQMTYPDSFKEEIDQILPTFKFIE